MIRLRENNKYSFKRPRVKIRLTFGSQLSRHGISHEENPSGEGPNVPRHQCRLLYGISDLLEGGLRAGVGSARNACSVLPLQQRVR